MTAFAVLCGKFIGVVLSECAPVLEGIIYRAMEKLFKDTAVVGKPVDAFERMWNKDSGTPGSNDPRGTGKSKD